MSLAHKLQGSVAASSKLTYTGRTSSQYAANGTVIVSYPAGTAAGDFIIVVTTSRNTSWNPAIPAGGWTLLFNSSTRRSAVFYRIASSETSVTITNSGSAGSSPNDGGAVVLSYKKASYGAASSPTPNVYAAGVSATLSASVSANSGGVVLAIFTGSIGTYTAPSGYTALFYTAWGDVGDQRSVGIFTKTITTTGTETTPAYSATNLSPVGGTSLSISLNP